MLSSDRNIWLYIETPHDHINLIYYYKQITLKAMFEKIKKIYMYHEGIFLHPIQHMINFKWLKINYWIWLQCDCHINLKSK